MSGITAADGRVVIDYSVYYIVLSLWCSEVGKNAM